MSYVVENLLATLLLFEEEICSCLKVLFFTDGAISMPFPPLLCTDEMENMGFMTGELGYLLSLFEFAQTNGTILVEFFVCIDRPVVGKLFLVATFVYEVKSGPEYQE